VGVGLQDHCSAAPGRKGLGTTRAIEHRLFKDGRLAAEGFETRVWVARDPGDPDKITSAPIPAEGVERLSAGCHEADVERTLP
jgi:hypothetical protein